MHLPSKRRGINKKVIEGGHAPTPTIDIFSKSSLWAHASHVQFILIFIEMFLGVLRNR